MLQQNLDTYAYKQNPRRHFNLRLQKMSKHGSDTYFVLNTSRYGTADFPDVSLKFLYFWELSQMT